MRNNNRYLLREFVTSYYVPNFLKQRYRHGKGSLYVFFRCRMDLIIRKNMRNDEYRKYVLGY